MSPDLSTSWWKVHSFMTFLTQNTSQVRFTLLIGVLTTPHKKHSLRQRSLTICTKHLMSMEVNLTFILITRTPRNKFFNLKLSFATLQPISLPLKSWLNVYLLSCMSFHNNISLLFTISHKLKNEYLWRTVSLWKTT